MWLFSDMCVSVWNFIKLVFSHALHLNIKKLGTKCKAKDNKTYTVFRETSSDKDYEGKEVTLVVAFRLFLIDRNTFLHWLFQKLSILNTPLWVGFPGFKTKFWMVDTKTQDYLGIYRYLGKQNAKEYAEYICAILRPVSIKGSVWYEIIEQNFESYIKQHQI